MVPAAIPQLQSSNTRVVPAAKGRYLNSKFGAITTHSFSLYSIFESISLSLSLWLFMKLKITAQVLFKFGPRSKTTTLSPNPRRNKNPTGYQSWRLTRPTILPTATATLTKNSLYFVSAKIRDHCPCHGMHFLHSLIVMFRISRLSFILPLFFV